MDIHPLRTEKPISVMSLSKTMKEEKYKELFDAIIAYYEEEVDDEKKSTAPTRS